MRLRMPSAPIVLLFLATGPAIGVAAGLIWFAQRKSGEEPLAFLQQSIDKGVIFLNHSAAQVEFIFPFVVWKRSPVRITQVETTCSCTVARSGVVGRELPPGSSGNLRIELRAAERAGPVEQRAIVYTEPAPRVPIILSVRATIIHPAQVVGGKPVVSGIAGGPPPQGVVRVTRLRSPAEAPLELDERSSDLGDLRVIGMQSAHPINLYTGTIVDNLDIALERHGTPPIGTRDEVIRLAWKNGLPATAVPLTIEVCHPVRPKLERVFLGEVPPGEERSIEVPLEVDGPLDPDAVRLTCRGDLAWARLSQHPWRLVVLARAPRKPGRFEGRVCLEFANLGLPAIHVVVSGITKDASGNDEGAADASHAGMP